MDSVLLAAAHCQWRWSEWDLQPARSLSLLIRVLPTMSEGFSQPLQLETYATVQSIEQRNLSGICYMLDLTPTRSSRWVSQVAEEWAVGSVLFTISLVQNFVLLVQRCVPSVVEHFRVHVSCYNTMPQGCLFTTLLNITACALRERERDKRDGKQAHRQRVFHPSDTMSLEGGNLVFFRPLVSGS